MSFVADVGLSPAGKENRVIRAVVFDWDGTLIDSRAALLGAWHESTEQVLADIDDEPTMLPPPAAAARRVASGAASLM